MEYKELPFGTRSPKHDCVFVWIYAKNCTPYQNYPYNDIPNVTLMLSELRWDGLMGGVGGVVETDDVSLEEAVKREAWEEIHYDLPVGRLEPLLTLKNFSGSHNHSFSLEVSYEELVQIRNNAHLGEHFSAENAGVNLVHICRYMKPNKVECGYKWFLEQQFIGSSKQELEYLVDTKGLLVNYTGK